MIFPSAADKIRQKPTLFTRQWLTGMRLGPLSMLICSLGWYGAGAAKDLVNLDFHGHYRSGPKTTIVRDSHAHQILPAKTYSDLEILLSKLAPDEEMFNRHPLLKSSSHYPRLREVEEQINVEVVGWIHAVKFEGGPKGDRDFHVLLGSTPDLNTAEFMTIEVSGLPPSGPDRKTLKLARQNLLDLFPHQAFNDRFARIKPAKKVRIRGSLFFDGDHLKGNRPGPTYAKPSTLWEIHPVYFIEAVP